MPNMWKTADKFLNLISLLVSVLGFQFRSIGTQFELNITLDFLIVQIFLSFCTVLNWKSYRKQKRRSLLRAFLQKSFMVFPPSTPPCLFFHSFHVYVCLLQRILSFNYFFLSFFLPSFSLLFQYVSRRQRRMPKKRCMHQLSIPISIYLIYLSICQSIYIWSCRDSVRSLRSMPYVWTTATTTTTYIYIYTTYIFTVTLV